MLSRLAVMARTSSASTLARLRAISGEVTHFVAVTALDILRAPRLGTVCGEVAHLLAVAAGDVLGVSGLRAFFGHVSV
jgi:hypothetical protein